MFITKLTSLLFAALLHRIVALPTTSVGTFTIYNNCSYPVYLMRTADENSPIRTLAAGRTYGERYATRSNGGGISIKVALNQSTLELGVSKQVQYEYTLAGGGVWSDISLVNCNKGGFCEAGFSLISTDPNCSRPNRVCHPGVWPCNDAYMYPTNDQFNHGLVTNSSLLLNLRGTICAY